jgi:hypothetical protein
MGVDPRRKMLVVVEVQSSKTNALENPQNWVSSPPCQRKGQVMGIFGCSEKFVKRLEDA